MSSTRARLDRAARAIARAGAECPRCGGADAARVRYRFAEDPPAPEERCPACGRVPRVVEFVIGLDEDARPRRAAAAG